MLRLVASAMSTMSVASANAGRLAMRAASVCGTPSAVSTAMRASLACAAASGNSSLRSEASAATPFA
ncbi:hypothetical protein D3C71_2121300 [compost metagenome]